MERLLSMTRRRPPRGTLGPRLDCLVLRASVVTLPPRSANHGGFCCRQKRSGVCRRILLCDPMGPCIAEALVTEADVQSKVTERVVDRSVPSECACAQSHRDDGRRAV